MLIDFAEDTKMLNIMHNPFELPKSEAWQRSWEWPSLYRILSFSAPRDAVPT